MPTRNWCYGAKTPDVEQAVSDAIFAAHCYRNRLCELELSKRDRHYAILRRLAPDFTKAEAAVTECQADLGTVREQIQAERIKQRSKQPTGVSHLTAKATELKEHLKELRAELKRTKHLAYTDPAVVAAMDQNTAQHREDCKDAKLASGLYWGTEAIVKQACGSFATGAPPRFKRYDGTGQLAAQLQGGLDCDDIEKYNTLCYLAEETDGRKRFIYIRIGSDGRSPVFAKVPIVFHRPLPAGKVKWAYLEKRKIADHVRWTIRLTIECTQELDRCRDGEVAIHTGWRMEDSGLRVATWLGSDGKRGCIKLPMTHCDDYAKCDTIRSARDKAFNTMVAIIRDWMKAHDDLPEWMQDVRPYIHAWKSPARLAKLYWQWSQDCIDGDDDIFQALNQWRKQDKHEWQHERRLSIRILRRRKHLFRNFAAMLSENYGVAIVSPIDAKELTENSQPEDLERDNHQSHRHAKWAAVSEFTQVIREKFPLHCIDVDCKNISRQCCNCGTISARVGRKVQCRECGHTHDVDENAVANTLARGEAAIKSGALLELVAAQEDKAAKQKEKLSKMQEANRTARKRKVLSK